MMHAQPRSNRWFPVPAVAWVVAVAAFLNAFAYVLVVAIPLPASDNWRFLDTFLGDFIENGFAWGQLFAQPSASDTNSPLYKLFLFFHTRYFGMDFRLEGVLGIVCAGLMVLLIPRAAAMRPLREWGNAEAWLVAAVALATFSLNSTNIYTWPLATQWYLPLLLATGYFWASITVCQRPRHALAAAFVLGVLLDEVAYLVVAAQLAARVLDVRAVRSRTFLVYAGAVAGGLALSRGFHALAALLAHPEGNAAAGASGPSLAALFSTQVWKAAVYPLGDSLIHVANLPLLLGRPVPWLTGAMGTALLALHGLFWWRVLLRMRRGFDAAVYIAAAVMLLCYALIAGVVLQRVPVFGFDYLHQPRYVMYYQLNLVAIAVLAYRELGSRATVPRIRMLLATVATLAMLVFGGLQVRLGKLGWEHAKYVSSYVEGAAFTLGALAADPRRQLECADILTICNYPLEQRQRILARLVHYRLNLFSPDFQAFHRLYPTRPVAPPPAAPVTSSAAR
jgi:hypothetical protein